MSILSRKPRWRKVPPGAFRLIQDMRYEVVPLKSLPSQIPHLPVGAEVSVTCSPAKGLGATLEITEGLVQAGYRAIPHIAARLVRDPAHTAELAAWLRRNEVAEIFLVGGDTPEPVGSYDGAVPFLADLLELDHGLSRIGVTAYPDGHALIPNGVLDSAIMAKQALLDEAGVTGHATTQMCFDQTAIESWIRYQRAQGLTLAIQLGLPGVVDRIKLIKMGARLGIGNSLRFLKKNGSALGQMLSSSGYDPLELIEPILPFAAELDVSALHVFTFNNVDQTAQWQRAVLGV